jgi:hypothetical protein
VRARRPRRGVGVGDWRLRCARWSGIGEMRTCRPGVWRGARVSFVGCWANIFMGCYTNSVLFGKFSTPRYKTEFTSVLSVPEI